MSAPIKFKCKTCNHRFTIGGQYQGLVLTALKKCTKTDCGGKDWIKTIEKKMMDEAVPAVCKVVNLQDHKPKALPPPPPEEGKELVGQWSDGVVLNGTLRWKRQ